MRTVRDGSGGTYVAVEDGGETTLVYDLETGEKLSMVQAEFVPVTEESPLAAAANALPDPEDGPLDSIADERALGLLVHLVASGPLSVMTVLEVDGLCESDLHGNVSELRAAGLVAETTVEGRRGYRATALAERSIGRLHEE